ncbi:MAG: PQQ-binding-like beta-propeller repeat protein, partial [Deltaproteobacteria bacterium]|nr:PQQ-binding-like beta-propeller repeat protein [Deltaproteobacteria bacterium]
MKYLIYSLFFTLFLLSIASGCNSSGSSDGDSGDNESPPVSSNNTPVADAGTNQNVAIGSTVTLDGNASFDSDSDTLSYTWSIVTQPDGGTATLSDSSITNPNFVTNVAGSYTIKLVVNDGTIDSAADLVTINATSVATNAAPVANAGTDQLDTPPYNTKVLSQVNLNGTSSSDSDGDSITYSWGITTRPVGSTVTLSGSTSATPNFIPDKPGTFEISLVVNDGNVNSSVDTVIIGASRIIWRYGGSIGYGDPFAIDEHGILYTGFSNSMKAINSVNGSLVWSDNILDDIIDGVAYFNSRVYAIGLAQSSPNAFLYSYDTTGDQQWKTQLGTYLDGPVIDANDNSYVVGLGKLWKVDVSGDIALELNLSSTNNYGIIFDAAGNLYYGGSHFALTSIDATGDSNWENSDPTDWTLNPAIDDNDTTDDVSDDIIYFSSRDDSLYAVQASTGNQIWSFGTGDSMFAQPIIGPDGTIYVGSYDNKFYAINPNGTQKWSFDASGDIYGSAALSADGRIYFGSKNDNRNNWSVIYALDAS